MSRRVSVAALGVLGVAAAGCASLQNGAKAQFVEDTACPAGRVSVSPGAPATATPPPEVVADAQRLGLWRKIQERKRAEDPFTYFDVGGCGKTTKMRCIHDDDQGGRASCSTVFVDESSSLGTDADASANDSELASLPHVAEHYDMPAILAALRGLTIRAHPGVVGPSTGIPRDIAEARCASDFAEECALLGWKIAKADAPADLDVTFVCNGGVAVRLRDSHTLEVQLPNDVSQAVTTFTHDGQVVETLPRRIPLHFVCDAKTGAGALVLGCTERIRAMSHALFLGAVVASQPLRDFAEQRRTTLPSE